ncbi:MAG: hypothetical protein Q8904_01315 [Bacteroidota bacterium]|nr:hypothetical protein [Bacteroidota bacterium]
MKVLKLIVFGIMLILACSLEAQLSVRLNIGTPPAWGPSGYDDVRYYYLPDIECYYDVQNSMFIYYSGNRWIHNRFLPGRYRNYDLYGGYKVPMNEYRGNAPYYHFREYRMRYAKGYRGREQRNIGERHDNRVREHEIVQPNRNNGRGNGPEMQPNNNRNAGKMNNQGRMHGNDKGNGPGNNQGRKQGNHDDKKEGHDNGNKR